MICKARRARALCGGVFVIRRLVIVTVSVCSVLIPSIYMGIFGDDIEDWDSSSWGLTMNTRDSQRLGQHSGKYFYTSDLGEWGEDWRPTLDVAWGEP